MTEEQIIALRVALSALRELQDQGVITADDYEKMKEVFITEYGFDPRTIFA